MRCQNCPKFFRQTRKWQKFHSQKCRRQFHENGTAYGTLKQKLEKQIEQRAKFYAREAVEHLIGPVGLEIIRAAIERRAKRKAENNEGKIAKKAGAIIRAARQPWR